jgi:putative RNA 2'-phosphotransferase
MDITRSRERLATFLSYVLGRNPYEFGLVPDDNGFVKIKEILRALADEDGWKHVRQRDIDELTIALSDPPIEITDELIRARNREHISPPVYKDNVPKLLYFGIRESAHIHVSKFGIMPNDGRPFVVLSSDREMAERIAKRKSHDPVILTINTHSAESLGVLILHAGESLFVAREIPLNCFTGPPLPEPMDVRSELKDKKKQNRGKPPTPGSFIPDFSGKGSRDRKKGDTRIEKESWKHNKKKLRKQKEKFKESYE